MPDEESFPIRHLDPHDVGQQPEPVRQADIRLHPDHRPTSVQLRDALTAAEIQRYRQVHWRRLLEQIARTIGAGEADLEELPALVDGLRTSRDQLSIQAADRRHALEQAQDRAGHLATATTALIRHTGEALRSHRIGANFDLNVALTAAQDALGQPHAGLAKGGILREPIGLTMVGEKTPGPCQPGCGIGYHLQGCTHIGTQLGIAPDGTEANPCRCTWLGIGTPEHQPTSLCIVASVPPVARESDDEGYNRRRIMVPSENGHSVPEPEAFATRGVVDEIAAERAAQDTKWGEQNHPDGTSRLLAGMADDARRDCQHAASQDRVTWLDILAEEFWEAMSEEDPAELRAELVQVAAVAVAWVENIDRRETDRG